MATKIMDVSEVASYQTSWRHIPKCSSIRLQPVFFFQLTRPVVTSIQKKAKLCFYITWSINF